MKFKYYIIAALFLFAALSIEAAQFSAKDLVGAWTTDTADNEHGYYTFYSNVTYKGSKGDMLFAGKWKLLSGKKLELTSFSDFDKKIINNPPIREVVVIHGFDGHALSVTWRQGKRDVWKKMPRWKGSPKY
jgi:hypothetical protein